MPTNTPADPLSAKVDLAPNHLPVLQSGNYTITVQQSIALPGDIQDVFTTSQKFFVAGPRFSLNPQDILAVFPPPGSLGDHSDVLPHVIFGRSTLPWERHAYEPGDPWLALLLFDEAAAPKPLDPAAQEPPVSLLRTVKVADLKTINLKVGDQPDDAVTVIDVPRHILQQIMPAIDELRLLAHVRGKTAEAGEVAVVIGSTLPQPGAVSIVHLVSVEGCYGEKGGFTPPDGADTDRVRLVSLYSWRFACVSDRQSFKGLLMHLNHPVLFNLPAAPSLAGLNAGSIPAALQQAFAQSSAPLSAGAAAADRWGWKISDGGRDYLVGHSLAVYDHTGRRLNFSLPDQPPDSPKPKKVFPELAAAAGGFEANGWKLSARATLVNDLDSHWWLNDGPVEYFIYREADQLYVCCLDPDISSTLRLPRAADAAADSYLKQGCVPLPHSMRQGSRSVSWYHGPLVPGSRPASGLPLPARAADDLVQYDANSGMFDVSYAAAWELGRLLTLQNKQVALDLFNWKRHHAQVGKDASIRAQEDAFEHLPFNPPSAPDLPKNVGDWFERLARLQGVPFNYLVADERMLPAESIRFFQVDAQWVECLLDGAFSIGRVLASDHTQDSQQNGVLPTPLTRSGFLLRSAVVAGWPGLMVAGYGAPAAAEADRLKQVRMESLSKNILLVMFEGPGPLQAVDIYLQPESMHFGIGSDQDGTWVKPLRKPDGSALTDSSGAAVTTTVGIKDRQVVDIRSLAAALQSRVNSSGAVVSEDCPPEASMQKVFTSADFALQMIESVESVRFVVRQ